jgi:hypothetical protein
VPVPVCVRLSIIPFSNIPTFQFSSIPFLFHADF